jgi:oxaloacetate decarboxylase alpha subunit
MDTKTLSEIMTWLKSTDLTEFTYKKDGCAVEVKTKEAVPAASAFESPLIPVTAPAIGIYHSSAKGKTAAPAQGKEVKEGEFLGVIAMPLSSHSVLAPKSGVLKIISVKDGQSAEYGTPLFFIEPK